MRIAYIGQMADIGSENGISKKIRAQTVHWQSAGHAVRYFSLVSTNRTWPGLAPLETELIVRRGAGWRMIQSFRLAARVRAWRPDVIYFRYAYHSAGFPALFRQVPTVAEINSDDVREYPLTLSWPKYIYHRATRRRLLSQVTGFVTVTRELASRFAGFRRPIETIANGISLADFSPAPAPPANLLRLIFIGSGTPWHGLERATELAHLMPAATIDVVGCTLTDWHRLLRTAAPPPGTIRLHGQLPRSRYAALMHTATAAIGTLALYKNHMDEACPLKVREYLATGLPVIGAYTDTDIPANADYFLRLPNDAEPLLPHCATITAWLQHWRNRRVPRAAVAHLDTSVKEKQRLAFLERIVRASRPS